MTPCPIGQSQSHNARFVRAKCVRPYSKTQRNDFRDAERIAVAVQCPTMKFVTAKIADQLDLWAPRRAHERLIGRKLNAALRKGGAAGAQILHLGVRRRERRTLAGTNWRVWAMIG